MMTYLIIDDEHIAHEIIVSYCEKLQHMRLAKQCYDAIEALEYLREHTVDLIFLDINMPKLKGFEFLRTLPSAPKVIVTTAYQEYALEGYNLDVTDYLLKPFSFERFLKAVNKLIPSTQAPKSAPTAVESKDELLFLYSNKKHTQIRMSAILFIEAAGNYVKVVTPLETHVIRDKISEMMRRLPDTSFIQTHKSFVVAKDHINTIEGNRITIGDHIVPIGKAFKASVSKILK